MCRLFGFKSTGSTNIRFSLVHAENALRIQSANNPDGWGIGFYMDGEAHIVKRPISADEDTTFIRLSDYISSDTVIAHVRKGPPGTLNVLNCHPFQYGKWMFAHNGSLEKPSEIRPRLLRLLPEALQNNIVGATDSELCFHLFLHILAEEFKADLQDPFVADDAVCKAVVETISMLDKMAKEEGADAFSRFNFMISNGHCLVASRRGSKLYYLQRYLQSDAVGMWAKAEQSEGLVVDVEDSESSIPMHSILLASEPITAEAWTEIAQDSVVSISRKVEMQIQPMDTLTTAEQQELEAWIAKRMPPKSS